MEGTDTVRILLQKQTCKSDMLKTVTTQQAVYGPTIKFLKQYKIGSEGSNSNNIDKAVMG
jgi:hypothetical protein